MQLIIIFTIFAPDTTLAHAVSRHLEVFVEHFLAEMGNIKVSGINGVTT